MKRHVFASCLALSAAMIGAPMMAQDSTMIVLDGSGSMWGQIGGTAKIEIARGTLGDVLAQVPEGRALGLMAYGHRRKGDCADIELLVPAKTGAGPEIAALAKTMQPKGKTPLSAAVKQAAEALKYTEDKATVILITDGLETCEMDPCALAADLEATGVDFTTHVVGFGLTKEEGAQVACLAEATGGKYIEAKDAGALSEALRETVVAAPVVVAPEPEPAPEPAPAPEPDEYKISLQAQMSAAGGVPPAQVYWVLTPKGGGRDIKCYEDKTTCDVKPGAYEMTVSSGHAVKVMDVSVGKDAPLEHLVNLEAGVLTVTSRRVEGGAPDKDVKLRIRTQLPNGKWDNTHAYGEKTVVVPANQEVVVELSKLGLEEQRKITVAPGATHHEDVVFTTGFVDYTITYGAGGPEVEARDAKVRMLTHPADISGKRTYVDRGNSNGEIEAPVGEYVLEMTYDAVKMLSAPFAIQPEARTSVAIVMDAGVLAVEAPEGKRVYVYGKKDLKGERTRILAGSLPLNHALPVGSYQVKVIYEDGRPDAFADVEVKLAERSEITLP